MTDSRRKHKRQCMSLERIVAAIQSLPDDEFEAFFRAMHAMTVERITAPGRGSAQDRENARVDKLRWRLARELCLLPRPAAFALLGELLVFVHLDGETTIEDFDASLQIIRGQFLRCKVDSVDVR